MTAAAGLLAALALLAAAWAAWPLQVEAEAYTAAGLTGPGALDFEVRLHHPWGMRWQRHRRFPWPQLWHHPAPPPGARPALRADPRVLVRRLGSYLEQGQWVIEVGLKGSDPARLAGLAAAGYAFFGAIVVPLLAARVGTVPPLRVSMAAGQPGLQVRSRARLRLSLARLAWILVEERWARGKGGSTSDGTGQSAGGDAGAAGRARRPSY